MKSSERKIIHDKYGGKCAYCGSPLQKGWHVDHVEPVRRISSEGITIGMRHKERHTINNMNPSCASCNINKHDMDIESFRNQISNFIHSLNRYSVQYNLAKRFGLITETNNKVEFYFEKIERNKIPHIGSLTTPGYNA